MMIGRIQRGRLFTKVCSKVRAIEEKHRYSIPLEQAAQLFPEEFTYQYEMLTFVERASNKSHFLQQNK